MRGRDVRTPLQALQLFTERQRTQQRIHLGQREVQAVYDGEAKVDLPDMDRNAHMSVPNLLAQGVDQMAARIASVVPMVAFASETPGQRLSDRRARQSGRIVTGWWQADKFPLKTKTRTRHLVAYGLGPAVMRYDKTCGRPTWDVRNPLETYASEDIQPGSSTPTDVIFAFRRTIGWLRAHGYGGQVDEILDRGMQDGLPADTQMTVLEYIDIDGRMMCLTGHAQYAKDMPNFFSPDTDRAVLLEFSPNTSGRMAASVPTRLTLSRVGGQFNAMLGMYYQQAKLMALEVIAVEKGIFPDTYLESRQGEIGKIIDGPHDGRSGKISVVQGGQIREIANNPGYQTNPTMDRLERAQRLTAGIPSEFGGESGTNIRTGRRGDAVLSAVIDFPVAEAQEVMAFAFEEENRCAIALAKAHDGLAPKTIYVGTGNDARAVTYVATKDFVTDEHVVSYPAVGTDLNSLMIGLGQRVGMGLMSKETAATLDPFIASPELEHDRIIAEGLEQALMGGLQTQAANGAIPPLILGKIMDLVANDKMELAQALNKVMEDAKADEAQAADPAQADPGAADMAAAAAAPSIAGQSPIPGASPGQEDLAGLMAKLRQPAMTIKPMRGAAQGAI
jgi:hypothetical protein